MKLQARVKVQVTSSQHQSYTSLFIFRAVSLLSFKRLRNPRNLRNPRESKEPKDHEGSKEPEDTEEPEESEKPEKLKET